MNIGDALKYTINELKDTIKDPHFEAELLLSESLKQSRIFILTHPEHILKNDEIETLKAFIQKRKDNTPLAYITHNKSFYGLDFYVDENVLIPRPETELMVDEALSIVNSKKNDYKAINIIDIGTGSGCIIISIAHNVLKQADLKNKTKFFAVDVSEAALVIAKKNSIKNKIDPAITFQIGNLLNPIRKFVTDSRIREELFIITANLPYLTKEQIESSKSIQKEPKLALDGGANGMELYIELFEQVQDLKKSVEADIVVLAEIDHTQADIFKEKFLKIFPDVPLDINKDLGGYERCTVFRF